MSFSFFLFSAGDLGRTGKPWENVVAVQSWIYGSYSFTQTHREG